MSRKAIAGAGMSPVNKSTAGHAFPRLLLLIFIFVTGFWRFEAASAQVQVTALTQGTIGLKQTDQIGLKRWGDSKVTNDVFEGMYLQSYDQLVCESGSVTMELTSSTNSKFIASGNFDIIVLEESDAEGFVVDLRNGGGNIQSSNPTSVPSGQVNMGSPLTEYAVRVYRTDKGPVVEYIVFEGDVTITPRASRLRPISQPSPLPAPSPMQTKLKTGEKLVFEANSVKPLLKTRVAKEDIEASAKVYAKVETTKARNPETAGDTEQVYADFVKRYSAVFSEPNNPDHRVNLAIAQVNTKNSSDALYQLNKAEGVSGSSNKTSRALLALTKGAALVQEKRPEDAKVQFQRAREFDEKVLDDTTMRNYGFNQATRDNIKLLRLRPDTEIGVTTPDSPGQWPIPERATLMQQKVFELIQQQRTQEAAEAMGLGPKQDLLKAANSIDAYLQAIIFFELKDPKSANAAAAAALSMTRRDRLLSKPADLASRKILRTTTQQ